MHTILVISSFPSHLCTWIVLDLLFNPIIFVLLLVIVSFISFLPYIEQICILPAPLWCRCHCEAPGRALRSKYKAELSQPEAERKAGQDWTSGPWETHIGGGSDVSGYGLLRVRVFLTKKHDCIDWYCRVTPQWHQQTSLISFCNYQTWRSPLSTCWHTPLETSYRNPIVLEK